jgi:hypothetical protein
VLHGAKARISAGLWLQTSATSPTEDFRMRAGHSCGSARAYSVKLQLLCAALTFHRNREKFKPASCRLVP